MSNELTFNEGLQKCFGISVSNTNDDAETSITIDENIYKTIEDSLKKSFGNDIALKITIDPSKYRKYYDGTYSSMLNDSISKIKHNGFEGVNLIEVAKSIYDGVNKNISQSILKPYNEKLLKIFTEVNEIKQEINNIIISDHLAKIDSYYLFYNDLQEELCDIMVTPSRRIAYLNTIVNNKIKIYENFIFLIGRIRNLEGQTENCYQYTPSEEELNILLLKTSFLIKVYLNNCIYEYVLAGNYTTSPVERIRNRCKEMEKMFFNTLESLRKKYNIIFSFVNFLFTKSCSNGFFVKKCLNSFDKNSLSLDYSDLDNLDKKLKNNLKNIPITSTQKPIHSIPNEERKKALKKLTEETEYNWKHPDTNNQDYAPNNY